MLNFCYTSFPPAEVDLFDFFVCSLPPICSPMFLPNFVQIVVLGAIAGAMEPHVGAFAKNNSFA